MMKTLFLIALVLAAGPSWAQTAVLVRADTLRAEPFADAGAVAPVSAGENLRIVEQKGTWSLVEVGSKRGWVRALNLKTVGAAPIKAEGVAALQTGRQAQGGISVPLAVRSLNTGGQAGQLFKQLFDRRDIARAVRVSAGQSADGSLRVSVDANSAGYAYVFSAGEAGDSLRCLFPNATQPDSDFSPGKPISIAATGQAREGVRILAIVSDRPIDLALPDKEAEGPLFRVPVNAANRGQLAASLSGGCSGANCMGYGAATAEVRISR